MTAGYRRLVFGTVLLTLAVIVVGAYVRLSDAGLACPDWPGCYGQVLVPSSDLDVAQANEAFPDRPVVIHRARKEMTHRYLAGSLGLAIALLAVIACRRRKENQVPIVLPMLLVGLVVFQAVLGMWTVTLLLKPAIVTAHLLGGMTTLALLWWLWMHPRQTRQPVAAGIRIWAIASVVVVAVQLTLGGWTSANYAALACPDFPTCQGDWWPGVSFADAFNPWRELGQTSSGAPLEAPGLMAIQITHRIGALLTLLVVGGFALVSIRGPGVGLKLSAAAVVALLLIQVGLGVAIVLMARPLSFGVAHNAVAALLLLAVLSLAHLKTNPVA